MIESVLEIRNLDKSFGGTHALDHVSITVNAGEIHGLVGANGSGKSTLIKIVTGALQADEGQILLRGESVDSRSPSEARSKGISAIYQEPTLIPSFTAQENIVLGHEPTLYAIGHLDVEERRRMVNDVLEDFGLNIPLQQSVSQLGVGQQRIIEVAKVLSSATDVICVDEATAGMSDSEITTFFRILRDLRSRGVTIIYISHYLENVFRLADRATVLRDGKVVSTDYIQETSVQGLISKMLGRTDMASMFPEKVEPTKEPLLKVDSVSFDNRLKDVSFTLYRGEILGIAGVLGAGKTELAKTIYGALPVGASGRITLADTNYDVSKTSLKLDAGIVYVPEDRKSEGLISELSVYSNLLAGNAQHVSNPLTGHIRKGPADRLASDVINKAGVRLSNLGQRMSTLSGGNQQKAIMGKWIFADPSVLLLDEPTRGIDVGAKAELYRLIAALAAQGKGVIVFSSEVSELVGLCQRVLVLYKGQLIKELVGNHITDKNVLSYSVGAGSE